MVRQRVRMRFCKQGDLRLIGHRDLMRCFERLFRRAGLPLAMSQGFHPKPRMTFPSALAVGIEAVDEVLELEVTESCDASELARRLIPHAPPGLTFKSVEVLPEGAKKARLRSLTYQVPIPQRSRDGLAERIDHLMAGSHCPIQRPNRRTAVDLRPLLEELSLREGVLRIRLRADGGGTAGP
ncbi:MAG: TIGR03936 family radical SAM-associated protein, partial [Planctomycetota bacterium]